VSKRRSLLKRTENPRHTVAIIDTGIHLEHPDLNVIRDVSFVGTATGDDDQGHGIHVAGIAAAKDDSMGVLGSAPGANLVAVKVLDSEGSGTTASVLQGIEYVIENADDTDVANLSLSDSFSTGLLPENKASDTRYDVYFHFDQFLSMMQMLREEKPIYFHYSDSKYAQVSTNPEPI